MINSTIWIQLGIIGHFFYRRECLSCGVSTTSFSGGLILFVSVLLLICCWLFVKPLIAKAGEVEVARKQIRQWKRNTTVFTALLRRQTKIDAGKWHDDFVLGNGEGAAFQFIVAVNPFCSACAIEYKILSELLSKYPDQISIIIRFGINYDNRAREQTIAVQSLLSAYFDSNDYMTRKTVLDDWFKPMGAGAWKEKYQPKERAYADLLSKYKDWCTSNKISRTPELFVNSNRLPELYHPDDLRILIPKLLKRKTKAAITINPI
ncbi:MAG TPA: hypothetical protein VK518_15360 [Puia sp.]|nr:hypothetical protein [Puia sp.]